jgi:hypothetical protein
MRISSLETLLKKKYCFLTSNCSTAIYILLKSLGLKKKVIIIPANICYDVVLSILFSGNIPYPLDIDKDLNLSLFEEEANDKKEVFLFLTFPHMTTYYSLPDLKKEFDKKDIKLYECGNILHVYTLNTSNKI